jgi:catechol 2,3-dioxygenase-like lactoylglutathione lyase family enzyme
MSAPGIRGLNHLTLSVTDLTRSVAFYRDLLGFGVRATWPRGAYLEAGSLWLCLSLQDGAAPVAHGDTHYALDVAEEDFPALAEHVRQAAPLWKANTSEGASLYFLDPDGHRLELHVGDLASRLAHYRDDPGRGVKLV